MLANASLNEVVVIDVSIGIDALTRTFEETDMFDRRRDPELDRAWVGDCKNERGKSLEGADAELLDSDEMHPALLFLGPLSGGGVGGRVLGHRRSIGCLYGPLACVSFFVLS